MKSLTHSATSRHVYDCPSVINCRTARRGFTLIEILLVVGLMLVLAAMVLPSIRQAVGKGPLQRNSQEMREAIQHARTAAIDTGLIYQVRFEVEGQYFVAIPLETEFESLAGETTSEEDAGGKTPRYMGQMDESLKFRVPEGIEMSSERLDTEVFAGMDDASKLGDAVWSTAIKFYPDGSATDMELEIYDDRQQAISISIRGLTGAAKVSPVYMAEDD